MSTTSTSPGSAPSMYTGPAAGFVNPYEKLRSFMVTSSVGMRPAKQSCVLNSSTSPGCAVAHGALSLENART